MNWVCYPFREKTLHWCLFSFKRTVEKTHEYFQIVSSFIHDNQKTQECMNVYGQVFESIYLLCSVFFFFSFLQRAFCLIFKNAVHSCKRMLLILLPLSILKCEG